MNQFEKLQKPGERTGGWERKEVIFEEQTEIDENRKGNYREQRNIVEVHTVVEEGILRTCFREVTWN